VGKEGGVDSPPYTCVRVCGMVAWCSGNGNGSGSDSDSGSDSGSRGGRRTFAGQVDGFALAVAHFGL
jgi:hypothetical protein